MENEGKTIPIITCCSIPICVFGAIGRMSKEILPPACILSPIFIVAPVQQHRFYTL